MIRGQTRNSFSPSTRLTIFGGLLLCLYIIFILLFYYRNNTALQESSLNRFRLDAENRAASIAYFFLERRYDVKTIADSHEVRIYFANQDMGMSKEYGLVVSLFTIQQLIRKAIGAKTINSHPVYTELAFLDTNKRILATSADLLPNRASPPEWADLLTGVDREPDAIVARDKKTGRSLILMVAPCLFKGKLAGWIIGQINSTTLYQQFIAPSHALSSKFFVLTRADGTPIYLLDDDQQDRLSYRLAADILANADKTVIRAVSTSDNGNKNLLISRCPIDPLNIFLAACVEEDEILGKITTWQFVLGASAMVFLIASVLAWSIRANVRHVILRTRLEEAKKQQDMLAWKNRQLEEEIRKRQRAEEHLRENEERYRKLFEFSNDAILILEGNSIIACNQKTARLLRMRRKEILGNTFSTFSPPTQPDGLDSAIECRQRRENALTSPQHFEWQLRTADDTLLDTEITMSAITIASQVVIQVLVRDITERKRTQEILVQTEKMMAVGGLAAGMAHEINNPLGIILQGSQNIRRRLGTRLAKNAAIARELGLDLATIQNYLEKRSIYRYLDAIQKAGERAAKIVRTMLAFGRSSQGNAKTPCDLNELLEETLELAASDYDMKKNYDFRKVEIRRRYGTLPSVQCARTEIGQVFFNIIKNAAQAMAAADTPAPRITIATASNGKEVVITFEDNGPGISEATQSAIFEPFFTTKPVGEGTGLGLSVSYFIITTHHNGSIEVASAPGKGARFTITLPVNSE